MTAAGAEFEKWWSNRYPLANQIYGNADTLKDECRAAWSACAEKAEGVAEEHQRVTFCGGMRHKGSRHARICGETIAAEIRRRLGCGK